METGNCPNDGSTAQTSPVIRVSEYWSHSYIPDLIRREGTVIDIGANNAGFSRRVAHLCKRVIGFEPDPSRINSIVLPANMEMVAKAVAAESGHVPLFLNREKCPSLHFEEGDTTHIEVEAITLEKALSNAGTGLIDLVKMDIEGEELRVLCSAPARVLTRVVQWTVEFHDFMDPGSRPAIRQVIQRMRRLGFVAFRFSFRNHGDLLFVNRRFVRLSRLQCLWIVLRFKYMRGFMRVLRRTFGDIRAWRNDNSS